MTPWHRSSENWKTGLSKAERLLERDEFGLALNELEGALAGAPSSEEDRIRAMRSETRTTLAQARLADARALLEADVGSPRLVSILETADALSDTAELRLEVQRFGTCQRR